MMDLQVNANFTTVTSLSGNIGSLGGGLPLTVNVGGLGLPLTGIGSGGSASISVSVGGLPCPLIGNVTGTSQLTCRAPAAAQGTVMAEYWNTAAMVSGYVPLNNVPLESLFGPPGALHYLY